MALIPPVVSASIQFRLPTQEYRQNDPVNGQVVLRVNNDLTFSSLILFLRGWVEVPSMQDASQVTNRKKEYFFELVQIYDETGRTLGSTEEGSQKVLKPGIYTVPFQFKFPDQLPPSCTYSPKKARICYGLEAIVDQWGRGVDSRKVDGMAVSKSQKLYLKSVMMVEQEYQHEVIRQERSLLFYKYKQPFHSVNKLFYNTDHPLAFEVAVEKPIYTDGEMIRIWFHFNNQSGRDVSKIVVKLNQRFKFRGRPAEYRGTILSPLGFNTISAPTTPIRVVINKKVHREGLPVKTGRESSGLIGMEIHHCEHQPSVLNCVLFSLEYYLSVRCCVLGSRGIKIRVPLTIASETTYNMVRPRTVSCPPHLPPKPPRQRQDIPSAPAPDWNGAPVPQGSQYYFLARNEGNAPGVMHHPSFSGQTSHSNVVLSTQSSVSSMASTSNTMSTQSSQSHLGMPSTQSSSSSLQDPSRAYSQGQVSPYIHTPASVYHSPSQIAQLHAASPYVHTPASVAQPQTISPSSSQVELFYREADALSNPSSQQLSQTQV